MNIKQLLNHQRHRSKPSSLLLLLLAILLLSVWASTAGGQDDPNKADVPSAVAAVENKPHSEEFRVGGSTIIVVETSPGDSKTEVIRQIIQTLEKSHLADKKTKYPELPGTGITVRLEILMEETARELSKLVLGLSELNLPDLRISLDRDDKSNKGIISASEDASADALARITDYLTTQKFMSLTVTAPPLKPVNDAVTGKLAAEIEVPAIEVSVFYLKYATAKDIAEKIGQLYPEQEGKVVVDERTNSLLIRGDNATIREYERLLDVLDADDSINPRATKPVGGFGGYSPFGGGGRKSGGDTASTKNQNTSPTGGSMPPEDRSNDTDTEQLKIFSLKNSNVRDAAKIIETLFGFPSVKVATDERTNSLIISGDKTDIGAIDEILLQLDSNESAAKNSATKNLPSVDANEPIISIAEYRQRLDALEQPVQQLAKQVRAAEAKLGKDHADSARLRAELRALVQQTFAARQEIQRAELAEFTRRLQRMQQSIDTRERISDKIVDRRVEDLLEPDATWDQSLQSSNQPIDSPVKSLELPEKFHGDWKVEQLIVKSGDVDLSTIQNPTVTVAADHFVIPFDGNIRETLAYNLLPGTPTKVDLILEPSGSKARTLGIIEVTDDTFKLCFREPADVNEPPLTESDRPRTFGPESKTYVVQCRRTPMQTSTPDSAAPHGTVSAFEQTFSMVQRKKREIPGFSKSLFIQLSDITRGRVFVEITDAQGNHLLERTPLKEMEFTESRIDDKVVYVEVTEMENHLIGQDSCRVRLSLKKPSSTSVSPGTISLVQFDLASTRNFRSQSKLIFAVTKNRVQLSIPGGAETEIQLTDFAGRHGLELAIAIEPFTEDPTVVDRLAHNRVPIEITNDDFDQFTKGESVTKVIYLPRGPSVSTSGFEQILSWQLVPEFDPVKIAEERGHVVAVVRMTPSQRLVVPIKDVSELKGKWRRIKQESVPNSQSTVSRPFDESPSTLHITDTSWRWSLPIAVDYNCTYNLTTSPEQVTLLDAAKPDWEGAKFMFELSGDQLFVASSSLIQSDEQFTGVGPTAFDTPGLLISTYQRAGVVTAIDADNNQVEISLGLSDDLKIGQRLHATSGDQTVGIVEVISVERDNCVGRILDVNPDRQMQNGDRAMILATPKTEEDRQE